MATTWVFLLCILTTATVCYGHQKNNFKPSLEVQNLSNDQPISKDQHFSKRKNRKTFVDRHDNLIDVDVVDVDDDYDKDHLALYKYTETYNTGPKTIRPVKPVSEVNQTSTYHYIHHPPPPPSQGSEVTSPVSSFPRITRIFGGFLKESKTKIEGRVYNTFNNKFCQFKDDLCSTLDIGFAYELPTHPYAEELTRRGQARKIESDHEAVFDTVAGLFNKVHLDGKSCVLRLICELAESKGLPYNGLLGRTFETLFLIDYGLSSTERLYEYISARMWGESQGNCAEAYPKCPFSIFNMMETPEIGE